MSKSRKDIVRQILIDTIYTPDAKPRFINSKWTNIVVGVDKSNLVHIEEGVEKLLEAFESTPEDIAYEILSCDEDYALEEMIEAIEEQDKKDGSLIIDWVDGVQVWQKLEYEFTCHEFLKHIGKKS